VRLFYADNVQDELMAPLKKQPAPPSRRNPEVSPELDAVVLKALEKSPENRYASAMEFARAIEEAAAPLMWSPEQSGMLVARLFADRREQAQQIYAAAEGAGEITGEIFVKGLIQAGASKSGLPPPSLNLTPSKPPPPVPTGEFPVVRQAPLLPELPGFQTVSERRPGRAGHEETPLPAPSPYIRAAPSDPLGPEAPSYDIELTPLPDEVGSLLSAALAEPSRPEPLPFEPVSEENTGPGTMIYDTAGVSQADDPGTAIFDTNGLVDVVDNRDQTQFFDTAHMARHASHPRPPPEEESVPPSVDSYRPAVFERTKVDLSEHRRTNQLKLAALVALLCLGFAVAYLTGQGPSIERELSSLANTVAVGFGLKDPVDYVPSESPHATKQGGRNEPLLPPLPSTETDRETERSRETETARTTPVVSGAQGRLTLRTQPAARVTWAGSELGETPLVELPFPVGTQELELWGPDQKRRHLEVEITEGEVSALNVPLASLPVR
jgi:hypothetical protein